MIKSIKTIMRQDRERYVVPRRVQDVIPIQAVWEDGIFRVGNKFSKTYRFTDINYFVASREDKESMFLTYSELLNSLDSAATTKLTICNRRQNRASFEQSILMDMRGDGLDGYRREYNQMLIDKATGANGIMQEKYVTVSIYKKDIEAARAYFARIGADLSARFAALGSKCVELDAADRLRILHDFYRAGEEETFRFDMADMARKGHNFKDYICPDAIEKHSDYLMVGDRYCRVLFLKDYASYIKDDMVTELTDLNRNLMLSIDILSVPMDEAVREVENRLLGVETNITNWQRRQNSNNNFSAVIPYDMELQRKESKEFLDDLTTRDQRMMVAVLTMVITADTKEQLDADTDAIRSLSGQRMCQMAVLKYQQLDGLNTALPIGVRRINTFRTLTTESLAVFMPFKVQEIMDRGGIYFGENAISHNLIMCNKANLLNQASFRLGVPGSGKSFSVKEEIAFLLLNTDDDILICDPEGEYAPLVEAMGDMGAVIRVAAGGKDRLNAMYMVDGYGENNPIAPSALTLSDLLDQYVTIYGVSTWAPSTYEGHKSLIDNYIRPLIGDKKLDDINPRMMDHFYKQLKTVKAKARPYGMANDGFITPRTIREIHKLLRNAFNQAVKWELMARNPVQNATLPKCEEHEREIWDAETLFKAIDLCDDDMLRLAMHLSFACSLRQGELLGLTWDCIDISPESIESGKAFVYIDKELQRVSRDALSQTEEHGVKLKFPSILACRHTVLVLKEPKTKTSVRKVFLPRAVAEMLVERKKEIDELKELLGDEYTDYNLVFASTSGTPIEGATISRLFNKLISDNGLPRVVFHSIRHTSTTYKLMLSGGDIKGVQGDTGHAQASMGTERYAHILDDNRRMNAERFQKKFYSGPVGEEPTAQPDSLQQLDAGEKQTLLIKLLAESPEMAAMIKTMAQAM